jgi:hypothetical protein
MGIEVTSKININKSIVTLVTSIISRACEGAKNISIHVIALSDTPLLCKIEVTKVTEVTRHLMIAIFWLPLLCKSYLWLPLPFSLEVSL